MRDMHNYEEGADMRVEHMREFVAIRDEGNFSRAARSLFMTQPALSRHMQDMERELGVRLLNRDKHSVALTDAGERAYKGFRQILRAYDRLTDDIAGYKAGLTGRLRIGMLYYTIRQDFGDTMERFSAEYPGVELRRFSYQPQEVFQALAEERIDIGVLPRANHPGAEWLCYQDVLSDGLAGLVSVTHPLAARDVLTLEDLEGETTVLLRDDPYSNRCYTEALERVGFTQRNVAYTDNIDTVPMELKRGQSVYLIPQSLPLPGFEGELVEVPIRCEGLKVTKSLVWRSDNDNPLVPLFLEMRKH